MRKVKMVVNEVGDSIMEECATDEEVSEMQGNTGMADALRKVLRMGIKSKKSSIVLAKAKLIKPNEREKTKKREDGFEVEKADGTRVKEIAEVVDPDIKPTTDQLTKLRKSVRKREFHNRGRHKPSPLDRPKERPLARIATRGVVQLFNAVREQQQIIKRKISEAGSSETKQEKVLKSINKKAFLDVLMGNKDSTVKVEDVKLEENKEKEQPEWEVLRDDFMMSAKLKDWDKMENRPEEDNETVQKKKRTSR